MFGRGEITSEFTHLGALIGRCVHKKASSRFFSYAMASRNFKGRVTKLAIENTDVFKERKG